MKYFGLLMFIVGLILLGIAFTMDTSVAVNYSNGNEFGLPERVNNIGLMADKQNYIIFGALLTILGVFTSLKYEKITEKEESEKVCPKCAEKVKKEALICRFCSHSFLEDGEENNEEFEMDENLVNSLKSINSLKKEKRNPKPEKNIDYEFCPACKNPIKENETECSDCGLEL